jgi:general secretion pathway protein C
MTARIFAFLVWAVLAACVAFWGLRLGSRPAAVPLHATPVTGVGSAQGDLSRLFGAGAPTQEAAAPAAAANTRFKLLGTFAAKGQESQAGWATVSVDNGPARTYRIGATLAGTELVLQQVSLRGARIGPEGASSTVTLELPALPAPATGKLPDANGLSGQPGPAGQPGASMNAPMSSRTMPAVPAPAAMAAPPVLMPPQQPPVMPPQMVQRNEAPDPGLVPQNNGVQPGQLPTQPPPN